jgi:ATP-dependent exoDNAse (exonuclease V) alpha subunit
MKLRQDYHLPEITDKLIVDTCLNNDNLVFNKEAKVITTKRQYNKEKFIYDFIIDKLSNPSEIEVQDINKYKKSKDGFELTEEQFDLIDKAVKNEVVLLTGYAGCGKTSSLTNLLDLYDDVGLSYTLLAPTGSASVVLEESTHRKASTAHLKCLTSTITSDILILDEMSMFDIDTLYMVFSSIENPGIRIILSGDDKQLAPVGLGCVFADLLTWKDIPKVSLSKPFRYGKNGISTVATNTRHQTYTEETDNLQHYKRYLVDGNNIEHCKASMLSCYLSALKHCKIKDLIGITGYNVGDLGVEELNRCIQAEINPPQPTKKEIVINNIAYRVGDRVVNTQNDYHALSYDAYNELKNDKTNQLTTGDVADETIANGMRGTIVNIYDDKAIVVLFDIDEKLIVYSPDKYNNLSLAYVINFHKSQGAGIKNVICLITPLHKRVLSRNLLYVGQTRAKENLIEILDEYTYKKALTIDALSSRKTNLQLFLNKEN